MLAFIELLIITVVPIVLVIIAILSVAKPKKMYEFIIKDQENFAKATEDIPIFGTLAKESMEEQKALGSKFVKAWGIAVLIIVLFILYNLITK